MWLSMLEKLQKELIINNEVDRALLQIGRLEKSYEKVNYAETLIRKHNEVFKFFSAIPVHKEKDDSKSMNLRVLGNNLYKEGKYKEALIAFNKSICFASSSENVAIGYGNRSAVLYEMGRFKDCKENIHLARNLRNLPESVKTKLEKRERQCNEKEQQIESEDWDEFDVQDLTTLSYREHSKVPFISNRLEIRKEGEKSRIYAKEFIEPGKTIIKEKIINSMLEPEGHIHCHYCFKANANIIPCPNCTGAMFCDNNCMNRANEEFHKWECPVIDLLGFFDDLLTISFRMILKMLHAFGSYKELKKYWNELDVGGADGEQIFWFNSDKADYNFTEQCRVFHTHVHSTEMFPPIFILNRALAAAFFKREILKKTGLKTIFNSGEQQNLFSDILFHHMLIFQILPRQLMSSKDSINLKAQYGRSYSVIKEIDWALMPNVCIVWHDHHLLCRTIRPIMKGELIQDNRGDSKKDSDFRVLDEAKMQQTFWNMMLAFSILPNMRQPHFPFV